MPCGSFAGKPRFENEWWIVFTKYQTCRDMGALPKPGGINQQDSFEMRVFSAMRDGDRAAEAETNQQIVRKSGPAALLMMPLLMGGRSRG